MGFKNRKKKEKRRIRSDDSENNEVAQKAGRFTDSPKEVSVSSILGETNSILYNEETSLNLERVFDTSFEDSDADSETDALKISHENSHPTHKTVMASSNSKQIQSPSAIEDIGNKSTVMPTNADLLSCLRDISSRLDNVDKKLQKLDLLEEKVVSFEKDMKKLWAEVSSIHMPGVAQLCACANARVRACANASVRLASVRLASVSRLVRLSASVVCLSVSRLSRVLCVCLRLSSVCLSRVCRLSVCLASCASVCVCRLSVCLASARVCLRLRVRLSRVCVRLSSVCLSRVCSRLSASARPSVSRLRASVRVRMLACTRVSVNARVCKYHVCVCV